MPKPNEPTLVVTIDESAARALHAVRSMRIFASLANAAEDDRHARILARYVYLHCSNACEWLTSWRDRLEADGDASQRRRGAACSSVAQLEKAYKRDKKVRDKLAAKRQSTKKDRGADLLETRRLWNSITEMGVAQLCGLAEAAAAELTGHPLLQIASAPGADTFARLALRAVQLDRTWAHLDATSYFLGEPHRVEIIAGGKLGARVTQINDYAEHFDVLYALRDLARGRSEVALALRGAWINELAQLVRTALGPGAGSLTSILGEGRGTGRYDVESFRDLLQPLQTEVLNDPFIAHVLETRDVAVAHLRPEGPFSELLSQINSIDPNDLFHATNVVLQRLDEAARYNLDLGLLLIGPRKLRALASNSPTQESMATNAANGAMFNFPFGVSVGKVGGADGSAYVAGVMSSRATRERTRWPTTASNDE